MHVRPCRAPADAGVADDFAALDARPGNRRERREMGVPGGDAKAVINHNQPAVSGMILRSGDDPIRSRVNWRAVVRGDIDAGVERAFTAERVQALTEAVRDVPEYRPALRRVRGIGQAHRRKQVQTAAGNGNRRGVALQKRVLLDRPVESILRVDGIVALIESHWMVAEDTVGHRHFGREGLE